MWRGVMLATRLGRSEWRHSTLLSLLTGLLSLVQLAHAQGELTNAERVSSWRGERVMLLGTVPLGCASDPTKNALGLRPYGKPNDRLLENEYLGKAGEIVEVTYKSDNNYRIVVALDESGERIESSRVSVIGFLAELESARTLIGKRLWSTGATTFLRRSSRCKGTFDVEERDRVAIRNVQPLTVTEVEWGKNLQPVYLVLRTDSGEELIADGWDGYTHFDPRFRVVRTTRSVRDQPYTASFYSEDPRRLFRGWGAATWTLIERSEIAIGMSEQMAQVACGQDLEKVGSVMEGSRVSTIFLCRANRTRFLVLDGKVTKYVQ